MHVDPPDIGPLAAAEDIARHLAAAHAAGAPFRAIEGLSASDPAFCYDVQDEFVRATAKQRRSTVVGYKVGLTSARMQEMCGIAEPICGQVLSDGVYDSGSRLPLDVGVRVGMEFEIAVLIGRDISAATSVVDIVRAVESVAPAMEIIDDRNADYASLHGGSLIADNAWNLGVVLGRFQRSWPSLESLHGEAYVSGVSIGSGSGHDIMGHPFTPLLWLTRHLTSRGRRLRTGDIVLTGSMLRTHFPAPADEIRFVLSGLGDVSISIGS